MRNIFALTLLSFFILGCNVNPNKEARIHKLETEMLKANQDIRELREKLYMLENSTDQEDTDAEESKISK